MPSGTAICYSVVCPDQLLTGNVGTKLERVERERGVAAVAAVENCGILYIFKSRKQSYAIPVRLNHNDKRFTENPLHPPARIQCVHR
jgi:hypothetical protein